MNTEGIKKAILKWLTGHQEFVFLTLWCEWGSYFTFKLCSYRCHQGAVGRALLAVSIHRDYARSRPADEYSLPPWTCAIQSLWVFRWEWPKYKPHEVTV